MKVKTNKQFVASLTESNIVGPFAQIVILTAIDNYTHKVANMTEAQVEEAFKGTMFHAHSWHKACQEIQAKMVARSQNLTAK